MNPWIAGLMFPVLFLLIFAGLPVAFALTLTAAAAGWFAFGPSLFDQLYGGVYSAATNFILSAIPMFVLMGALLERSGIAARLFQTMQMWLGRLPGGLAVATIAMAAVFAASAGVVGAVEIMVGLMAIPAMQQYRYNNALVAGTVCAGGSLGTMIPPSVIAVMYASLAQISIGEVLAATVFPGVLMIALFLAYVILRCWLRPQDGPPMRAQDVQLPLARKLRLTVTSLLPALLLIIAVLGSLLSGMASPTEAAALGAFGALLLCLVYGQLNAAVVRQALNLTVRISAMILLIVAAGTMFMGVFAANGGARLIQSTVADWQLGVTATLALLLLIVFLLGFVLDWTANVLICVPLFTPMVRALGVDPVWFATLVIIVIQTSYLTPPMASSIFYLKSIAPPNMTYGQMCRGVLPFIAIQLLTLALVAAIPALATWLPGRIVGFG